MVSLMKNPTKAEKDEIMRHVQTLLDTRDTEIYFTLSREMRSRWGSSYPATTLNEEVFEPTGATAICVSLQSAPAILWKKDIEDLKKGDGQ